MQYEVAMALGKLIQTHPANFLQVFSRELGGKIMEMQTPGRLASDRRSAVFVLDDIVEYLSASQVEPWIGEIVPALVAACETSQVVSPREQLLDVANLNQAASYGLGVCAAKFPSCIQQHVRRIYMALQAQVSCPADLYNDESGFGHSVDNAASCMLKMAIALQGTEHSKEFYLAWLGGMPMRYDVVECRASCAELLAMVEANRHELELGTINGLTRVVRILAAVVATDMIEDDDTKRAVQLLKRVQASMEPNAFPSLVGEEWERLKALV